MNFRAYCGIGGEPPVGVFEPANGRVFEAFVFEASKIVFPSHDDGLLRPLWSLK